MDTVPDAQIATLTRLLHTGAVGAWARARRWRWVLVVTLGAGCGIRDAFEQLDRDHDGVMLGEDCAEDDPTVGSEPLYSDQDGDGHGVPPQIGVGCEGEPGTSLLADDCDDDNIHIWEYSVWYLDNDRDGFGVDPGVELCASEAAGYALVAGDCLDDDPGAFPGAPTSCDGDDNDCDGQVDPDCELPWGTLSGTDADWLLQGTGDAQLGAAVAPAGDVDCDGLDDVVVGAPGAEDGDGATILAYGAEEGLRWTMGEESERLALLKGEGGGFGSAVAGRADFNGDGCDDLLVGAPWSGDGAVIGYGFGPVGGSGSADGSIYVMIGPWLPDQASVSDLLGVGVLTGRSDSQLGAALHCGGDIYGDGRSDCLVSAPYRDTAAGEVEGGAVLVLSPPMTGSGLAEDAAALLVTGTTRAERLGSALSAGDLDADGVSDLAIGAATDLEKGSMGKHPTGRGRIYLVFDTPRGVYDVEGVADLWLDGGVQDGTGQAVAADQDLDADGYDDLVIGAPSYEDETGTPELGRLLTFSGATLAALDAPPPELSEITSATVTGGAAGDQLGASVALIADLTRDERAELLVGAPGAEDARGFALLFVDALSGSISPESASLRLEGSGAADNYGRVVGAAGDLNGLGLQDLLVGGATQPGFGDAPSGAGSSLLLLMDAF